MPSPPLRLAVAALLGATLAGCGKSLPAEGQGRGAAVTTVASTSELAVSGTVTKNTTRLGGSDPVADAAAVALAVHPGLTPATRPQAVVLVDKRAWPVALAAAALASYPLQAPLLYSEGNSLPAISGQALATLRPTGTPLLAGAQVIEIGTSAAPAGYRVRLPSAGSAGPAGSGGASGNVYALAARIENLVAAVHGGPPQRVIVVGADGPPALAMPAAGLAAETGTPILLVNRRAIPAATQTVLSTLHRPTIYVVGPSAAVSHSVFADLARIGPVRRIDAHTGGESGAGSVANAIGVARFKDGSFGWGVDEPGHGLVFATAARPLDAPAAAPLSASGDYGPLLLLEHPGTVPPALAKYLSDIEPGAPEYQPVRGFYNHGWLIGDEQAIAATTQAELDRLLETSPQRLSATPSETSTSATSPPEASPEAAPPTTSTKSP
ncbi:MAG: cell wall-binding repeat-containing protein [Solirubrobacteraceae bacterium]